MLLTVNRRSQALMRGWSKSSPSLRGESGVSCGLQVLVVRAQEQNSSHCTKYYLKNPVSRDFQSGPGPPAERRHDCCCVRVESSTVALALRLNVALRLIDAANRTTIPIVHCFLSPSSITVTPHSPLFNLTGFVLRARQSAHAVAAHA